MIGAFFDHLSIPSTVVSIIMEVFWFVYSMTDNIVGSMGITAGFSICFTGILYMLSQIKKS